MSMKESRKVLNLITYKIINFQELRFFMTNILNKSQSSSLWALVLNGFWCMSDLIQLKPSKTEACLSTSPLM